jgi:hypothetical protein
MAAMADGKSEVLEAGTWLREQRAALGASTKLVASFAQLIAQRQGDPVIIHQQQLAAIENATEDKGPAKLRPWFRYVRAAFDSGLIGDALSKKASGEARERNDETFLVHNSAGEIVGRLTLLRGKLQ